jgi:branched-chain amino acid transport system substrate-binding protein
VSIQGQTYYGRGPTVSEERTVSRREFLKLAGVAGATIGVGAGLGGLIAACGGSETTTTGAPATTAASATTSAGAGSTETTAGATTTVSAAAESGRDLKLGLIEPKTGALAAFAIADDWYVPWAEGALKDGIVCGDGKKHMVKILRVDSQSDSNRASQVAGDLMLNENVDMVMASGSPDTVVPVADQCETNEVIGLFNFSPWQAVFGTDVERKWSWGAMLGSEQTIADFTVAFDAIPNNKKVGMLFANDADAAAWMADTAAPKVFKEKGFTLVVPTYYTEGTEDFTAQISVYKKEGVDIICGTNNPPDWVNFVNQALQQGLRPKFMSSGKALLFPQVPEALASGCYNFIGEMSWGPAWPFKDSLTGKTCKELGDDFEAKMNMQWQQTIGQYSKIEWAVDLFKRAKNPEDKSSVLEALPQTKLETINGLVDFTQPVDPDGAHNVANNVRPVYAGSQWVKGTGKWKFDYVEISNAAAPGTEVAATPLPMVYL